MYKNTEESFGWIAIAFHWLSALVVIGLFALGFWMVDLNYYSNWYKDAPHIHKSVGLLLAGLTIARLAWKFSQPLPAPLGTNFEKKVARSAHGLLYLLMLSLFVSGYLISTADGRAIAVFDWFSVPALLSGVEGQEDIAGDIHEWLAYGLVGLAVLHGFAAFKHHFIGRNNTLLRMLTPQKET